MKYELRSDITLRASEANETAYKLHSARYASFKRHCEMEEMITELSEVQD